jgi:hypothetical protein
MLEILMNSQNEQGSAADTGGINSAMSRHMAKMVIICFLVITSPYPEYQDMSF